MTEDSSRKSVYENWSLDSLYLELGYRVAFREDEVAAGRTTNRTDRRISQLKSIIANRHAYLEQQRDK